MRDRKTRGALRKRVRHWHLPFSALCVESSLIFLLQKDKKKEKKNTQGTYLNNTTSH